MRRGIMRFAASILIKSLRWFEGEFMYIINDICYAGALTQGIKIMRAQPLQGKTMLLTFSTGETRLLDVTTLQGEAFKVLSDEKIFNTPTIFYGALTWANGTVDLAPEAAYSASFSYTAPPSRY